MRDMLEWPRSDGCLASDSKSRACTRPAGDTAYALRIRREGVISMTVRSMLAEAGVSQVTVRDALRRLGLHEALNFFLTNQLLPRTLLTRCFGWFSQLEQPLVRDLSLATWRMFTDLDLSDAATQDFASLHACFIRQLAPGARPVDQDPETVTSPCDGIVVMCGQVDGTRVFQVKGSSYELEELLVDPALVEQFRDGSYVT